MQFCDRRVCFFPIRHNTASTNTRVGRYFALGKTCPVQLFLVATVAALSTAQIKLNKPRKDAGAECRHDMRPSVQLPSVSGANSKLGLTMVRSSLQSAPELPALYSPPVSKRVRQMCGNYLRFSRPVTLTLTFNLLTENRHSTYSCPGGKVISILIFLLFCFRATSLYGTDGQTDGRTDGGTRRVMRPMEWYGVD